MRTRTLVLIATALVACAHSPSSADAGVTIEFGVSDCLPSASPDVLLRVRNTSSARVAFRTYASPGPPYRLDPSSVQLLVVPSEEPWHVVLEHSVPSTYEVALGPGDQADFAYEPSLWPSGRETGFFKLRLRDDQGRFHDSSAYGVCNLRSAPGSSSQPNPLHGSA